MTSLVELATRQHAGPAWLALIRPRESGPFAGVAMLGMVLSGQVRGAALFLVPIGVLGLAVFAFAFNDLCDVGADARSISKAGRPLVAGRLSVSAARALCLLVALGSMILLVAVASPAAALAAAVALVLGGLYSAPLVRLKAVPLVSTAVHLVCGTSAYVVGAWAGPVGVGAPVVGAYFGMVFAAGHLHHEVADAAADGAAGIRTTARWLGGAQTLWLGFALWTAAAAWFSALTAVGTVPVAVGLVQLGSYAAYASSFLAARGLPPAQAVLTMRPWYRAGYWIGGALMLALAW